MVEVLSSDLRAGGAAENGRVDLPREEVAVALVADELAVLGDDLASQQRHHRPARDLPPLPWAVVGHVEVLAREPDSLSGRRSHLPLCALGESGWEGTHAPGQRKRGSSSPRSPGGLRYRVQLSVNCPCSRAWAVRRRAQLDHVARLITR